MATKKTQSAPKKTKSTAATQPSKTAAEIINASGVSLETLESTADKAPRFLRAVGRSHIIARALGKHGYTADVHRTGWRLYFHIAGTATLDSEDLELDTDVGISNAGHEVEDWAHTNLEIIRVALEDEFPAAEKFVFAGITGDDDKVVSEVGLVLGRLGELATGKAKTKAPKDNLAAAALVAKHCVSDEERARVLGFPLRQSLWLSSACVTLARAE